MSALTALVLICRWLTCTGGLVERGAQSIIVLTSEAAHQSTIFCNICVVTILCLLRTVHAAGTHDVAFNNLSPLNSAGLAVFGAGLAAATKLRRLNLKLDWCGDPAR